MKRILPGRGWLWLACVVVGVAAAGPAWGQVKWTTRASPINSTLQGVGFGNGIFVAVAVDGTVAVSTDSGTKWKLVSPGASSSLTCVAYGNGTFVAMGVSGVALTSANGTVWRVNSTGVNFTPAQVIYANGRFTAVGSSGLVETSANGRTWTQRALPGGYSGLLRGVTFGDGQYIAVGASGAIFSSPTGATWTQQTSGTGQLLYDTAYGAGNFSVSGGVMLVLTSKDGAQWSSNNVLKPSTAWFERVIFGPKVFVGVGVQGNVQISPTGGVWTQQATGTSNELLGIAEGNNEYVAVGTNGIILTSPVAAPVISKQPASVTVKAGETAKFDVTAKGAGGLTYQWAKNGANLKDGSRISGATGKRLMITKVVKADASTSYEVRITDAYGTTTSSKVTLKVK